MSQSIISTPRFYAGLQGGVIGEMSYFYMEGDIAGELSAATGPASPDRARCTAAYVLMGGGQRERAPLCDGALTSGGTSNRMRSASRKPLMTETTSLIRELKPVQNNLPNAPALCEPVIVTEGVMDSTIQSGPRRFLCGLFEGAERARLLGWHQAMIDVRGIRKRPHAEQVG